MFVGGTLLRLLLAPITSWAVDTPGFVNSVTATIYTGDPYGSTTWFNPPLAPYLAEPFFLVLIAFTHATSFLVSVPAISPVVIATGVDPSVFPTPAALMAWKLPLIGSDVGVGILLLRVGREFPGPLRPEWVATAWFLNPLVIWASSVHGEVDTLAVLFLILALWWGVRDRWLPAGGALALAVLAKGYPIALLPMFVAAILARPAEAPSGKPLRRLARFAAGVAAGVLPFVPILSHTGGALLAKAGNPTFGGISLLGVFNAASPRIGGAYAAVTTSSTDAMVLFAGFRVAAVVAVAFASIAIYLSERESPPMGSARFTRWAGASLLGVTALFLSDSAPQPENVVGLLPLILLAAALWRPAAARAWFVALSLAGTLMYWSFLTPAGMFYPLAWLLGPSAVQTVNGWAIAYIAVPGLRGALWLLAGVLGGGTVVWIGVATARRLFPRSSESTSRFSGGGTEIAP